MTRMRRVACVVASALVGFIAGIATAMRPMQGTHSTQTLALQDTPSSPSATAVTRKRPISGTAHLPPMPDAGIPLKQTYAALATRAEAGDSDAAKRLVAEIDACRGLTARERQAVEIELRIRSDRRNLDGPYAAGAAHSLAGFEALAVSNAGEIESLKRVCVDVGAGRLGELGHWLYRVAELGDAKAAQRFASGTWIAADVDSTIDDGAIAFWRTHALDMAKRALAGGELSASVEIAQSYFGAAGLVYIPEGGGADYLGNTVSPDPMHAAAYLRVATMIGYCEDCYLYAIQMERDFKGTTADARVEAERICATELPGLCTHLDELPSQDQNAHKPLQRVRDDAVPR